MEAKTSTLNLVKSRISEDPLSMGIAMILVVVVFYLIAVSVYTLAGLIQDTLSPNRRSIASKIVVSPDTIDTIPESILAISRGTTLNSLINVNTHNSKSKAYEDVRLAVELRDMIRSSDAVAVAASKSQPADKTKIKLTLRGEEIDQKMEKDIREDIVYGMRVVTSTSV